MLFLAPGQHQLLQSPGEEHLGLLPYAVSTCSKLLAFHCIGKEVGFSAKKHVWYLSSLKALFVLP